MQAGEKHESGDAALERRHGRIRRHNLAISINRRGPKMSERAREFLDHWLSDHVSAVADTRRLRETVRLVTLCREDAIRAGLAPEELREASGGDLIGTMLVALSAAVAPTVVPTSAEDAAPAPEEATAAPASAGEAASAMIKAIFSGKERKRTRGTD